MEALQARHRKEQRDLQSQITQRKKSATKKTRKGVNDECDRLQYELTERQHHELAAIENQATADDLEDRKTLTERLSDGSPHGAEDRPASSFKEEIQNRSTEEITRTSSKKPNRQKARMARRTAEQEVMVAQAEQEAANVPDLRAQERATMQKRFEALGLQEIEVRPDGHCMYSAVARQLQPRLHNDDGNTSTNQEPSYVSVRTTTAKYINENPGDFVPFLEEDLETYVSKIRDTAEWGGQLELQAISRAYQVEINVLQANGEVIKLEPQSTSTQKKVWLAYYRHSFGLGEHYNGLINP